MLRSVIEGFLTSSRELQMFLPFIELLELSRFYDIHLIHGGTEFGKDIIAKKKDDSNHIIQFSFQLKAGDINLAKFKREVQPQLLEAHVNKLSHPNFDNSVPNKIIFVTSGTLLPPATIAFQEFNRYLESSLHAEPVETWEKQKLIVDFKNIGIEPFFDLHHSPELIGSFFQFYSRITNNDSISTFDIESYSQQWLNYDWSNTINRLQILFESYYFSKLLLDKGKAYESAMVLSALIRVLVKNKKYMEYSEAIEEYFHEIVMAHYSKVNSEYDPAIPMTIDFSGIFNIFYHPISCLKTLELFSIYIVTLNKRSDDIETLFLKILDEQKGSYRIISDNYAVSIVFISLALFKLNQRERLRKYLNNVCVWLCDRYDNMGISPFGSSQQEEIEQLLSEDLSGLLSQKYLTSFAASALLDMTYLFGDKGFYEIIANDLRAVSIILEFYHVLIDDALFTYSHKQIVTSNDPEFSLDFKMDYDRMIKHEREINTISIRDKSLLFIIFLLRDRYFPSIILDIISQSHPK
jgi:hypothetical protein